ncbi:MAG: motility associated factor glycosyltransferase family protein, partial [Chlamydiae bacterium]|nr:motility associated factor glycosyltransferase family protein [Chlamydiota bacterium]
MTTSLSLWQERYAQLHFLLQLYDPPHQPLEGGSLEKWSPFLEEVVLYKKKLIFLVGVELGCTELVNFLKKHSDIQAILFESDLGKIRTWIETQEAEKLLQQPQVQIRYVMEPFTLEQALLEALQESPSAPFSLKVHSLYKKEVSEEVLESFLLRKAIRLSACLQETKYYHLLSRQLLANTQILLKSFYADDLRGKFQGVPAIVCGAGPSLKGAIPWLKQAENKALILAGGSTIAALTTQGVTPHLGLVFDPNPGEYARLKASSAPEMALLFGLRVLPEVLEAHQGPTGYMKTFSGGA